MIVFDIPKVILQSREKVKIFNFLILTMSGPYGLYMYALETCVCSRDMCLLWRHVSALETWYMLCGHGICGMDMGHAFLLEKNIYGVFLLEKNIWLWKMSSCWIRVYGYGRCLLVGEEHILILILILIIVLASIFIFLVLGLVLFLFLCCCCCLKLFKCALRLAAGAFFL